MPVRYLKPGVRDSEHIDSLTPIAETLFYRLLVTVDDFGRFDGRPSMIKAACFPIKESVASKDCEAMMAELVGAELADIYLIDGKPYLRLLRWDNVPRAKESKYPPPVDGCIHLYTNARECGQMFQGAEQAHEGPELPEISSEATTPPVDAGKIDESIDNQALTSNHAHLQTSVYKCAQASTDVPLTETETETKTETANSAWGGGVGEGATPGDPTGDATAPPSPDDKKLQAKRKSEPPDWADPIRRELWGKAMPFGFTLPESWIAAVAEKHGCDQYSVRAEAEAFVDYWTNGKGRRSTKLDWFQAWSVWCSKPYALTSGQQRPARVNGSRTWEQMKLDNTSRAIEEFVNGSKVGVTIDA